MSIETIRAEADAHPACGYAVYLDQSQCGYFEVSYWDESVSTSIAASTLLKSKDYDQAHKDLLSPIRSGTVCMERAPGQGPGWFTITRVFPPYGGW